MNVTINNDPGIGVGIKHGPPVARVQPGQNRLDDYVAKRLENSNPYKRLILSVEEHKDTGDWLEVLLGINGYDVNSVNGEADAMQLATDRHFDLYLIGDLWPIGANIELARKIRKVNRYTPLIFHSAQAKPSHVEWRLYAGGQEYLIKPCDIDQMVKTIRYFADYRPSRSC